MGACNDYGYSAFFGVGQIMALTLAVVHQSVDFHVKNMLKLIYVHLSFSKKISRLYTRPPFKREEKAWRTVLHPYILTSTIGIYADF